MKKYLSILLILTSCIYPFEITDELPEKLLVVEGYVSNRFKDSEIRLSYSNKFQTRLFDHASGAQVEVIENGSVAHEFLENAPGIYIPADSTFIADPFSVYKLHIIVDGKTYESNNVQIKKAAEIENLAFTAVDKYSSAEKLQYRALDIQATTFENPDASKYHRYSVEETWLVTAKDSLNKRVHTKFIYDDAGNIIDVDWDIEFNLQSTYCWSYSSSSGVSISSTEGLIRNQLVSVPIFTISLENTKLLHKYSVLIKQYSIPKEVHYFLSMINKFSVNDIALYDTQPGFVEGNIKCLNDEEERVIGIFYASDVVEGRMFIRIIDLAPSDQWIVFRNDVACPLETVAIPVFENADKTPSLTYMRDSLIYYQGLIVADVETTPGYETAILTYEYCADCRVMGTNIKPDFWGEIFE